MDSLVPGSTIDVRSFHLTQAFFDGVYRVFKSPAILVGMYAVTLLSAVPLGLILKNAIATHLGQSVAAETVVNGISWQWWEEFSAQANGFEQTFSPVIIGFGAVLNNLSMLLDNQGTQGTLVLVITGYLIIWGFLVGGILDRFARGHRVSSSGFFAACGTNFFRFCRLALLVGLAYWILFNYVHSWLFDDLYSMATKNLTVERTGFLVRIILYVVFGMLLILVNIVADYAKIRVVVEDRRSMIGALMAATRFVYRQRTKVFVLYLLNGLFFISVLGVYAIASTSVGPENTSMWIALLVGQAYVIARLFAKLTFYASQISYFQSQLAHSNYLTARKPVWPESPAAEAIAN